MTDSNRTRLTLVPENTLGTTPNTPRMRKTRMTGEGLLYKPEFVNSDELREDRMNAAPIKVGEQNSGPINFEMSYPVDGSSLSSVLESCFLSAWVKTPSRDNDGTADSVITDVATTNTEVTHVTGATFVAGHLVRFTGFGVAGNNVVAKCTTGGATSSRYVGSGITNEAAPPAAARMKVVGFEGAAADITATSTGLGSTLLDFTTLGLVAGMWVKIGGSSAGQKFATTQLNDWARVSAAPTANALTLDNLPATWTTDAGTGKTIRVFFGDYIKNGTTLKGESIERGFMAQTVPTYIVQKGMCGNVLSINISSKQKITMTTEFVGMGGSQGTVSLDDTPDEAPDPSAYPIMAASANVGRVAENGATLTSPNWIKSLTIKMTNNLVPIEAADSVAPVDIGMGSCDVEATAETYFGDNSLLTKLFAGTISNLNARAVKNSQAIIFGLPAVTYTDGTPNAAGKNQRVMLPLKSGSSIDTVTNAHLILNRLEYYAA